jgi:RNA polymerase sigma-70 factor (ECF subfamily)
MPRDPAPTGDIALAAEALAHLDSLHQFARYLTRDASLAEDLVQETFARCLAAQEQFAPGSNLRAWLFRILRNAFLDTRRRANKNPVGSGFDFELASYEEVLQPERLRDDFEIDRLRRLVAEDIEAALATLSDDARTVVLLDVEGFTEAEMATIMESPHGTIKSRLARARAALRKKLKEYAR